jgi:hypothetical protein
MPVLSRRCASGLDLRGEALSDSDEAKVPKIGMKRTVCFTPKTGSLSECRCVVQGIAGNTKGKFEVEAQFLSKLNTNHG